MNELEETSSPSPSEIMEKTMPARLSRDEPEQEAEREPGQSADEGNDRDRHVQPIVDDSVHRVDRDEAAEAEIDGVAEGKQARLPEEHIVGQGEDDHDAHDAHHRQRRSPTEKHAARRGASERKPAMARSG